MTNFQQSILFLFQLAFILAVCRIVGLVARRIGQPQVVGEMIAGVLMGPSLFGLLLPDLQSRLFTKPSMTIIYSVSQLGLVLYMFLVGLEFQVELLKGRLRSAATVSLAGILAPFLLGALLATFLIRDQQFFAPGVRSWEAMLFMGAAMSITAFPMLARIIRERGLTGTSLGTLALSAGALDDAAAWCILAIVLASFNGQASVALLPIVGGVLYATFVFGVGKPLLRRLGVIAERNQCVSPAMISFVLMLLLACASFTDAIGIYAVFGAFVLGVAMPRGIFSREVQRMLEPTTTSLLLPLFFVYSGLNTRLGLVATSSLWVVTLAVLLAACIGKGFACWLAARARGESQSDALAIGALMNSRGLMELIILNIGLERGVITGTLFTIMVVMAVVTTLMASPLFVFVYARQRNGRSGFSTTQQAPIAVTSGSPR
jgi:Kef-type K+ transport system membrane component KefB